MAGKIPAGTFNTRVNLDGDQSVKTLRQLKTEVSALTSGWKAQEAQLKSSGDALGAAKTKYEGLSASVKHQEDYISKLRSEQSKLDTSTNKGSEDFAKMEKQIAAATVKLESMSSQQSRAKSSMDYYKSGVAEAQKELTRISETSKSYVTRLQAEGKATQAAKAEASGLGSQYSKMETIYRAQVTELNKIAAASGKSSDAYAKQSVRVNETATKMAQAKTRMGELNAEIKKANPSPFTKLREALTKTNDTAKKTESIFGKVLGANIVSNAVTNAWGAITAKIGEAKTAGMEYLKEQDQMNAVWLTLTGNAKAGQQMVDMTNQLSVGFGQDVDLVNELNQQFYHVLDNEPATKKLTSAVLTMGDAVGLSSDNLKNLGLNFTHMMSSSLLQLGDFNHITDALPMYGEALLKYEQKVQKNSKLTMSELRKEMSAGKISAKDAEVVMEQLGDKYHDASENLMKTIPGMERVIAARMPALIGDIEKPIMNMQNPLLGTISKWVQDPKTDAEFTKVGKAASKGLSTVSKAFAEAFHLGNGTVAMDTMMDKFAKGITTASNTIADHAPQIKTFFSTMFETGKSTAKLSWTVLADGMKALDPPLKALGDFADAHPKLFGNLAAGLILYNTAAKRLPVQGFLNLILGSGATGKVGLLERATSLVSKLASVGTGATKTLESAASREATSGVTSVAASTASKTSMLAKVGNTAGVLAGVGTVIDVGSSIVTSLTSGKTQDKIKAASKGTGAVIGGGIGAALGSIIPGAGTLAGAGIGSAIGDMLGSSKIAQHWAKSIHDTVKKATAGIKVSTPKMNLDDKALGNQFSKYAKSLSKKMVVSISTDPKSLAKASSSVSNTYTKMQKSVDSYYKKKEDSAQADLKKLVANGTLTQKQADKQFIALQLKDKAEAKSKKSAYADMQKSATSYYAQAIKIANGNTTKLQAIAKKDGKNSTAYEKEKNKELLAAYKSYAATYVKQEMSSNSKVTASVKAGATQQTKLLQKLTKDKGKLNVQQLNNTAKNAKAEYNAAVKPAQQARDQVIKAAQSKYNSTVKTAKHEYKDLGTISKTQYKDIVAKAKAQRTDVVDAANDQYKKTTKHATDQYSSVKKAINKQKEESVRIQRAQMTGVTGYATTQSKSVVSHATKQANSSLKANHSQAKGTHSIFSGLASWFNKLVSRLGGEKVSVDRASYTYSPVSGLAYATGGVVGNVSAALVGEAGPELRYSPYSGKVDLLGSHGAEFASVKPGESILNAADTKRLLSGTYTGTLPGYATGTSTITSFLSKLKSGASSIFDKVTDATTSAIDAIKHPVETLKKLAASIFNVNSVSGVGSLQRAVSAGQRDKSINAMANMFDKIKKAFDAGNDSAGGSQSNPGGSGVKRWKSLVKKALKANGFAATASQVSAWLRVIARESNGNPKAVNNWDSNAKAGHPSKGLVQTIDSTFQAYAFPGHKHIFNGYDDLLAGINYMKHIYGSGASAFARVSGKEGYANGGFANTASIFGEDGLEAAIPLSSLKSSRGYEMLGKTAAAMAARDNVSASNGSGDVSAKLDKLITLMTTLVNDGVNETIEAHFHAYLDKHEMTKEMVEPITIEQNRRNRATARQKGKITWS